MDSESGRSRVHYVSTPLRCRLCGMYCASITPSSPECPECQKAHLGVIDRWLLRRRLAALRIRRVEL